MPVEPDIDSLTSFQTEIFAHNLIAHDRRLTRNLVQQGSCESSYSLGDKARFRVHIFSQRGTSFIILRKLSTVIPTMKELGLPKAFYEIPKEKNGMILVTGGTGTGKSTSLAALLREIEMKPRRSTSSRSSSCIPLSRRPSTSASWGAISTRSPTGCARRCARRPR